MVARRERENTLCLKVLRGAAEVIGIVTMAINDTSQITLHHLSYSAVT